MRISDWSSDVCSSDLQLLLVSAGFDAHWRDPLAQLQLDADDYAWLTGELRRLAGRHAQGRLVSTLEGGYDLQALRECSLAHVRALAGPAGCGGALRAPAKSPRRRTAGRPGTRNTPQFNLSGPAPGVPSERTRRPSTDPPEAPTH